MRLPSFACWLLCVAIFSSCKTEKANELYATLEQSLGSSDRTLDRYTASVLFELDKKLNEAFSQEKAGFWHPKAIRINEISKKTYVYIETLKGAKDRQQVIISRAFSAELFAKLCVYRDSMLSIHPKIKEVFKDKEFLIINEMNISERNKEMFYKSFFQEKKAGEISLFLSTLQNRVKIFENKLVVFCNEHVGGMNDWFDTYSAIIGQNKAQLLPGQFIEITAGVGAFSVKAKPVVSIKKKLQEISEDGAAHYKARVPSAPGNYSIPVEISFIDEFGKQQTISKSIEYKVVKPQ